MPVYEYKALTEGGKPASGLLDASTPREARERLRARRFYPTEVKEVQEARPAVGRITFGWLFRKKTEENIAQVTRQLAALLGAGIPLAEALGVLVEQVGDKATEAALRDVRESLTRGSSFADALARHPAHFSDLYRSIVRSGEVSGTLEAVLERLADYLWKKTRLSNRVRAALTYPGIVTVVGSCVVFFLMVFIVPRITILLSEAGKVLPTPTLILISVSFFLRHFWWLILLAFGLIYLVFRLFVSSDRGRLWYDTYKLRLPIIGELLRKSAVSRFAITFASLLRSGIPVLEALEVVKSVVDNHHLARTIDEVERNIVAGTDISGPLKRSGVFPPVVGYMIAVGERTGRLEDILDRISETYNEEVEVASQKLTAWLEPILIVIMAIVVGFIALSILLPILELGEIT